MLVTAHQMKAAEEIAFRQGSSPSVLMEVAGEGIARCIRQFFPIPGTAIVVCGKGHNGGDALVAARNLALEGWRILLRLAAPIDKLASLTRTQLAELTDVEIIEAAAKIIDDIKQPLILLDGLLGIGSTGAPRGTLANLIRVMNQMREQSGGFTVAVDLPSGLDATTGEVFDPCVQADLTITLGAVKTGLVDDRATGVVGRVAVIPLPGVSFPEGDSVGVATAGLLRPRLPVRNFDSYKGTYGRIGILAGSRGTLGAARLSSAAAVHAGGGLVSLYALPDCFELLASLCIPEVMVKPISSYREVLGTQHDVLAIGPGLGRDHDGDILAIIRESTLPCVVDADALNAVSTDPSLLLQCAGTRLLTPHPGEMERLFLQAGRTRREWAEEFIARYPVTLLLKGARTIIAQRGSDISFNTTGNPGMGSGGMGDVLTGVCAALIGSGHPPRDAAILGAWLCGRAAEIAIFNGKDSQESLSATSVIEHLGVAARSLRAGDF